MNVLKRTEAEQPKKTSTRLKKLHDFDFNLNRENAPRLIPFVLYVCLWIIIYIANHHYGEKTLSSMDRIRKEVKDLKADYQTINNKLSKKTKQSEVADSVARLGLLQLVTPPQRIKIARHER